MDSYSHPWARGRALVPAGYPDKILHSSKTAMRWASGTSWEQPSLFFELFELTALLLTERIQGIDCDRLSCRDVTGQDCEQRQQQRRAEQQAWVVGANLERFNENIGRS